MKKIAIFMLTIAMAFMFNVSTASAWTVSIEPFGCTFVEPGETFYADVFFNADPGGNFLESYMFALGFDPTELTWISSTAASQHTPPSPLFQRYGPPLTEEYPGLVMNWAGDAIGQAGYDATGKTKLASAEFTAHPDMFCDGEQDVWFGDDPWAGSTCRVDGVTTDILGNPEHLLQGPSVAAVPIPGTVLLLGSGLLGIVGIRRKPSA